MGERYKHSQLTTKFKDHTLHETDDRNCKHHLTHYSPSPAAEPQGSTPQQQPLLTAPSHCVVYIAAHHTCLLTNFKSNCIAVRELKNSNFRAFKRHLHVILSQYLHCNKHLIISLSLIQGDQKVSVYLTITVQLSGARRLFDHPVLTSD